MMRATSFPVAVVLPPLVKLLDLAARRVVWIAHAFLSNPVLAWVQVEPGRWDETFLLGAVGVVWVVGGAAAVVVDGGADRSSLAVLFSCLVVEKEELQPSGLPS